MMNYLIFRIRLLLDNKIDVCTLFLSSKFIEVYVQNKENIFTLTVFQRSKY